MRSIHILNGDALSEQFPSDFTGQRIILRECLMDGEASAEYWEAFYQERWQFLNKLTGGLSFEEYQSKSVSQIEAITKLSSEDTVFLWFEEDLFCQVNFWFCLHILLRFTSVQELYLVKPDEGNPYSFASCSRAQLRERFNQAEILSDLPSWSKLWPAYQLKDWASLEEIAQSLTKEWPFVLRAVEAQLARLEREAYLGRPMEKVLALVKEGMSFPEVFQTIWATEGIYGYGDLQVKQLYDRAQSLIKAE